MKRQSFTLVEMLTVLAIIMVLAGLLYPAITSSRTSARATACLSNQKQVITAILQAMNANNQRFYSPTYTGTDNGADDSKVRWTARLKNRKYLPEYEVMRCTEVLFPPSDRDGLGDDAFTFGAVNHADTETKGFDFRGTKFLKDSSKNDVPPTKLMLGACSWNTKRQGGALLLPTDAETNAKAKGTVVLAHRGAVNMFFYDGRATALNVNELTASPVYYPSYGDSCAAQFDKAKHTIIK